MQGAALSPPDTGRSAPVPDPSGLCKASAVAVPLMRPVAGELFQMGWLFPVLPAEQLQKQADLLLLRLFLADLSLGYGQNRSRLLGGKLWRFVLSFVGVSDLLAVAQNGADKEGDKVDEANAEDCARKVNQLQ